MNMKIIKILFMAAVFFISTSGNVIFAATDTPTPTNTPLPSRTVSGTLTLSGASAAGNTVAVTGAAGANCSSTVAPGTYSCTLTAGTGSIIVQTYSKDKTTTDNQVCPLTIAGVMGVVSNPQTASEKTTFAINSLAFNVTTDIIIVKQGASCAATPTPTAIVTNTPTPTVTITQTPTTTNAPSDTPIPTDTPLLTDTPISTSTDTPTPTVTDTLTPTVTNTGTPTPVATDTPTATPTPTNLPTGTNTPTSTVTNTPIKTNTPTPTNTPMANVVVSGSLTLDAGAVISTGSTVNVTGLTGASCSSTAAPGTYSCTLTAGKGSIVVQNYSGGRAAIDNQVCPLTIAGVTGVVSNPQTVSEKTTFAISSLASNLTANIVIMKQGAACGGTPTVTPTTTSTQTSTPTPTLTTTPTPSVISTSTVTPTSTPTPTPTKTPTSTPITAVLNYVYDNNDALSQITYPNGAVVAYSPDALGRATQVSGYASGVSYFANSQLKQLTLSNTKLVTYVQDNNRLLPKGMTVSGVVGLSYVYDSVGNLSSISDSLNPTYNRSFGYDGLNRLTSASGVWGVGTIGYDAANNISSKTMGVNSLTYTYDTTSKRLNSITGTTPYTFAYDVYGNVISNGRDTFTYDDASQLKMINQTTPTSFTYDGNGNRVTSFKGADTRYFVYSKSGSLMYEKNLGTGDSVTYIYLQGSLLAQSAVTSGVTQTSYYHNDLLGSPIAATSQGGTLLWREEYDPYGSKLLKQNTTNRLWYTGHAHDEDSGLTYMGARYYDPIVGRFMGIDPVGFKETNPISFNRYAYANNNPYKFIDPDGRDAVGIIYRGYKVDTGLGFHAPLGHAGVLLIDNKSGATRYYEYGRYNKEAAGVIGETLPTTQGNIRKFTTPDVKIGTDGKPTEESLQKVYKELSEKAGKNNPVDVTYHKDADFNAMQSYIMKTANDPNRDGYSITGNNCYSFKNKVIDKGTNKDNSE